MEKAMWGVFIGVILSVLGWMIIDGVSNRVGHGIAMKCIKYNKFEHNNTVYECREAGE